MNASDGMTAAEEQNAKIKESVRSAMQQSFSGRHAEKNLSQILAKLLVSSTRSMVVKWSVFDGQYLLGWSEHCNKKKSSPSE